MDNLIIRVIDSLRHVDRDHGEVAFRKACRRALVAICSVMIEDIETGRPERPSATARRGAPSRWRRPSPGD